MGLAVILICATAIYITHVVVKHKYPKNNETEQKTDNENNDK